MDNRTFARPIVLVIVLGVLILSILCCVGTFALIYRQNAPDTQVVQPTQAVVVQPTAPVVILPPNANEAYVCAFAQGVTSEGQLVAPGSQILGPAFVKPNPDISWGLPIYIGETYQVPANSRVVAWRLVGDNDCVDSQHLFFTFWQKTEPKIEPNK